MGNGNGKRGWQATKRVMARAARGVGNKEGNGKEKGEGGKGNSDGDEGGRQAMATTWAMAMAKRWQATKKGITRVARAIAMAMMIAGKKEGNVKGDKGDGDGN